MCQFIPNFGSYVSAKYCLNWYTVGKVIAKIKRVNFLLRHSVYYIPVFLLIQYLPVRSVHWNQPPRIVSLSIYRRQCLLNELTDCRTVSQCVFKTSNCLSHLLLQQKPFEYNCHPRGHGYVLLGVVINCLNAECAYINCCSFEMLVGEQV